MGIAETLEAEIAPIVRSSRSRSRAFPRVSARITPAGDAAPDVSTRIRRGAGESPDSSTSALASSACVSQHTHPAVISRSLDTCDARSSPSIPTSPRSLMITAVSSRGSADSQPSTSVDFPAPRNPVTTVTGMITPPS